MKPFALAALGFSSVGLAHAAPPMPLVLTEPRNAAARFAITQAVAMNDLQLRCDRVRGAVASIRITECRTRQRPISFSPATIGFGRPSRTARSSNMDLQSRRNEGAGYMRENGRRT